MELPPPQPHQHDDARGELPPPSPTLPPTALTLPPSMVPFSLWEPSSPPPLQPASPPAPYFSSDPIEPERPRRRRALVAVGLVVVLGAGAFITTRSGHLDSGKVVTVASLTAAAGRTTAAKTASMSMDMDLKGGSGALGGRSVSVHAKGGMDFQAGTMAMTMTMDGVPGADGADIEMRYGQGLVYMRSPMLDSVSNGKWIKMDLAKMMAGSGVDLSKLTGSTGMQDPKELLDVLAGVADGDVTKVGRETVDGVDTTHFHATIDAAKAMEKSGAAVDAARIKELLGRQSSGSMPVDVWVDDEGRVVQEKMNVSMAAAGTMGYTIHFGQFGRPVDVAFPADADTVDMSDLMSQVGKG